jgi:hypothetical protein
MGDETEWMWVEVPLAYFKAFRGRIEESYENMKSAGQQPVFESDFSRM